MRLETVKTRSNKDAMWEEGGGSTNTGSAQVIALAEGGKPVACYINRRGNLSNGQHGLVTVKPGMIMIQTNRHREDFETNVYEVIELDEKTMSFRPTYTFLQGEWDNPIPEKYLAAVEACKAKASCYHCREPHYCLPPVRA